MEYMGQQMQNQIEAGMSEAARCYDLIAELKAERDQARLLSIKQTEMIEELATHNELLISAISERFTGKEEQPDGSIISDGAPWALQLLRITPQQCLTEIRAEAVSEFANWAFDTCPNIDCMFDDKDDYIAKIRQGGAK